MIKIFYNDITFEELVEALSQALIELQIPHSVTQIIDTRDDSLYIMYGLNSYLGEIPPKYIAYQLEQTGQIGEAHDWFGPVYLQRLRDALEVWDYSIQNIKALRSIGIHAKYVPLTRYRVLVDPDPATLSETSRKGILFFGSLNERRRNLLDQIQIALADVPLIIENNGLWGDRKVQLVREVQICLNIHYFPRPILETSRLSYLISAGVFVISERSSDLILDKFYERYCVLVDSDQLAPTCRYYLDHPDQMQPYLDRAKEMPPYHLSIPTGLLKQFMDLEFNVKMGTDQSFTHLENPLHRGKFQEALVETRKDGSATLILSEVNDGDLPPVSILTLTRNRSRFFHLATRNILNLEYPKHLIEWIILDDSDDGGQATQATLQKYMGPDDRVKFEHVSRMSITQKRNLAVQKAAHNILIHQDDDDYYFPQHLYAKVQLLRKYGPKIGCVGCSEIGVYHVQKDRSFLLKTQQIAEASMAFTRDFWEELGFPNHAPLSGEGVPFTENRRDRVMTFPYWYNLIALTHGTNVTKELRAKSDDTSGQSFFGLWDFQTQMIILDLLEGIKVRRN